MTIEPFSPADVAPFLRLAAAENWVAEAWEFEFLLNRFPQGCFIARCEHGDVAGFVTALRHERSGWIGNLLVAPAYRGRGIGERLFAAARDALRADGVVTFWLTASRAGQALYTRYGFTCIDRIVRLVGTGRQRHGQHDCPGERYDTNGMVSSIDGQAWGDRRDCLLAVTAGRGRILCEEAGFVVMQPCGTAWQAGPFSARDSATAQRLFDAVHHALPSGTKISLDAPASNRAAQRIFSRQRMVICGSAELMYAGQRPDYRPELLYGLATMGSCG